jgi:hypothetical protein
MHIRLRGTRTASSPSADSEIPSTRTASVPRLTHRRFLQTLGKGIGLAAGAAAVANIAAPVRSAAADTGSNLAIAGFVHITGAGPGANLISTTRGQLIISDVTGSMYSSLDFQGIAGQPIARIGMRPTDFGSLLQFATSNNYGAGLTTTVMTLDHLGRVGIGTTSPTEKLDVAGNIRVAGTISVNGTLAVDQSGTARQAYYA